MRIKWSNFSAAEQYVQRLYHTGLILVKQRYFSTFLFLSAKFACCDENSVLLDKYIVWFKHQGLLDIGKHSSIVFLFGGKEGCSTFR